MSKPVYAQQDNTTFNLTPVAVVAAATCKLSSTLDPVGVQGACRDGPTQRYDNRLKVPHVHVTGFGRKVVVCRNLQARASADSSTRRLGFNRACRR